MTDSTSFSDFFREWDEFLRMPTTNPDFSAPELSLNVSGLPSAAPTNLENVIKDTTETSFDRRSAQVAFEETFPSQDVSELLFAAPANLQNPIKTVLETPPDTQPEQGTTPNPIPFVFPYPWNFLPPTAAPVDPWTRLCIACFAPIPLPPPIPPPQIATLPPHNRRRIPQRPYKQKQWNFTRLKDVSFGVNGCPGVNMGDALRGIFTGLDGRDDLVLQDANSAISCRLLFPGYPLNSSPQIFTTRWNKGRDQITRSGLSYQIAKKLKQYLDSMAQEPYSISESTPQRWKIGEGFMHLDNMFLVRLESATTGSWQPQIWVADPAM